MDRSRLSPIALVLEEPSHAVRDANTARQTTNGRILPPHLGFATRVSAEHYCECTCAPQVKASLLLNWLKIRGSRDEAAAGVPRLHIDQRRIPVLIVVLE